MAQRTQEIVTTAPPPARPGAGRGASLPRDPGRATEVLYRRHGRTVFRFAWHLLGRREDAEDATQATFLAVHGALAGGTAVLEPGAWVLRIARNECMGRLRQRARLPGLASLDDVELAAEGRVERSAELRDEIRVARATLGRLPSEERAAFVLREWLGLETAEVALALGLSTGAVDGLAGRARRSLVLAVGGLEPAAGCSVTRAALEAGTADRAVRVHLLRCPVCRGVRRALRAPEETVGRVVPLGIIAERLADALPGFSTGGGGIVAALAAKAAAAPLAAKTVAVVAAALVTAGVTQQAVERTEPTAHVSHAATARGGEAHELRPVAAVARPVTVATTTARATTRTRDDRRGGDRQGSSRGRGSSSGRSRGGPADRNAREDGRGRSGKHGGGDDQTHTTAAETTHGSGKTSDGDGGSSRGKDGGSSSSGKGGSDGGGSGSRKGGGPG